MDEQQTPVQQTPTTAQQLPVEPAPKRPMNLRLLGIIGFGVFMSGIIIGLLFLSWTPKKSTATVQTTAVSATPTPLFTGHGPSYIATQSAFLDIKTTIASISASIDTTTMTDTGIKPPTLDLPLGFTAN